MRVYELAKILGKSNKELMKILEDLGVEVKTHMSSIENDVAQLVEDALRDEPSPKGVKSDVPLEKKKIVLGESETIKTAAEKIGVTSADAVKVLMSSGMMVPATSLVNDEILDVLGQSFDVEFELSLDNSGFTDPGAVKPGPGPKLGKENPAQSPKPHKKGAPAKGRNGDLVPRPPIVTVMGHVDHGKTTLLDTIRHTNVTAREAGGITQHIGAYIVLHEKKQIVFLDTPGHEAFTAMRARGASVTDVVILVVAADDGVMPQTREAIDHIKAAGVPIVVAVNKVDKPNAKPDRVRQQLSDVGLVPEEWGGDVIMVDISAKSGDGIERLLEMVLLVAEMQELKGDPKASPQGVVIEAELDKGKGPVATVIIQQGTLRRGDIVLFNSAWGKIRALIDTAGKSVDEAGPSTPVEILGLTDVPQPGETFLVVPSEREARNTFSDTRSFQRDSGTVARKVSLEDLYSQMQEGQIPQLSLLVKCDVQGSVEALCASLEKLATPEVGVSIVHKGVGRIAESDVMLASASNAVILGFNVRPDANAKKIAEADGVEIRLYDIIYDVIDDVKAAMEGLLKPTLHEQRQGEVEIREIFKIPKAGKIAGCHVTQGLIRRSSRVRVVRGGIVIWDGNISTLRYFKDETREVKAGFDCGICLAGFQDFEEGDVLEAYEVVEEKRTL
ncbi:MAG: translation initiation factor IF-2 [Synergistaceae bacterium]|jgi:translation initiation factor IF-2|nr:translation initiation factor IF-2 [Synergistaceae bacterium]